MPRIVTIHQPNYLPWIGFFSKISRADCLIIYDCAQYEKNGFINRNKIRTNSGFSYLTIPISHRYLTSKILDIPLPVDHKWRTDHRRQVYQNYIKSPFFKDHAEFFEKLYRENFQFLWQLNEKILLYLLDCFKIKIEIFRASELPVATNLVKTDLMVAFLKSVGADCYLSGPSGKKYLEIEKFPPNNLELKFFEFQHPVYEQRYPGFEPQMSAIDLLFNMGPRATQIIQDSGSIVTLEIGVTFNRPISSLI
jgi:hypothetical protein